MIALKSAEELFKKYAIKYRTHHNPDNIIEYKEFNAVQEVFFAKALTEHDKEIISKIEEMIKENWSEWFNQPLSVEVHEALTELLTFIKEK